jgi:hypothetical protein
MGKVINGGFSTSWDEIPQPVSMIMGSNLRRNQPPPPLPEAGPPKKPARPRRRRRRRHAGDRSARNDSHGIVLPSGENRNPVPG